MRILFALLLSAPAFAADEAGYVNNYTEGASFSVMLGVDAAVVGPSNRQFYAFGGGDFSIRIALSGFLIAAGIGAAAPDAFVQPHFGLGYAIALSRRVALSPTARVALWFGTERSNVGALAGTLEVPVTVFVTRALFVEPYLAAGVWFSYGLAPHFEAGLRAGWTF